MPIYKHLYAFLTIHNTLAQHRQVLDAVNENPLFWKTCLGALQTSFFITLGRVFGTNAKQNLFKLLKYAENHQKIFSLEALGKRKLAQRGFRKEWLTDYLAQAYVPTKSDFDRLSRRAAHYGQVYITNYKPIRDKIFAHTDVSDPIATQSLFAKTKIREMENMFIYLNKVYQCLWELFENGNKPLLRPMPYSANRILKTKLPEYQSTKVQEQIVQETLAALKMIVSKN